MGNSAESPAEVPLPTGANTPAEFVSCLRALRTWSGLTYRQLEGKAATHRDALPASTIATTLGRTTLPRERFVDAFTRACGLGDDDVRRWLDVRRRIAMNEPAPQDEEPAVPEPPRWRQLGWSVAAALAGLAVGVAGSVAFSDADPVVVSPAPLARRPVDGLDMQAVGSWARIHPVRSAELCVTESHDRTGRYTTEVAGQRRCTETVLPYVYLEPVGVNVVQIQWHHPGHGVGCLTVLREGPGTGLVEPRDDCADGEPLQRFALEKVGTAFRIRTTDTDECLGPRDQADDTEVVPGPCTGVADQEFSIELYRSPD